jgi:hypothetical protein
MKAALSISKPAAKSKKKGEDPENSFLAFPLSLNVKHRQARSGQRKAGPRHVA